MALTEEQIEREVDRVLSEAHELFRTTHWTQRHYHVQSGGKDFYCAVGAINNLANGHPDAVRDRAILRVARTIRPEVTQSIAVSENDIEHWNDAPDRKLPDVLEVFEKSIVRHPSLWRRLLRRVRLSP